MMKRGNRLFILAVAAVLMSGVLVYANHTNRWPFSGNSVAGLPSNHIRLIQPDVGHFTLLFSQHGGAYFNHRGHGVRINVAYYQQTELILHETIAGMSTADNWEHNGALYWGLTTQGNQWHELRALVDASGIRSNSSFDFSQIDFEPSFVGLISSAPPADGLIEIGRRYILQAWQSGSSVRADNDFFHTDSLNQSEHTVILYVTFD